jgi:hypothetical protein
MPYLVTNITDATPDPKQVSFHDIGNRVIITLEPGETIDLERFSTRNQILDSTHLKVHLREGRITVDTLGSAPRERIYVDAIIDSDISVGSVTLEEPLLMSVDVGGRIIWESASIADSVTATLIAPATTGLTQATGDYTKYNIGGPYNVVIPVTPGAGNWSLDISAKLTILKCTPVPAVGNAGWFDYNSDTNILTRNITQTGNCNLYDFDVNLFSFARKIWGRKQDGAETLLEATNVVGKLLYNSWQIRFQLDNSTTETKCAVIMTTAMKKNI